MKYISLLLFFLLTSCGNPKAIEYQQVVVVPDGEAPSGYFDNPTDVSNNSIIYH